MCRGEFVVARLKGGERERVQTDNDSNRATVLVIEIAIASNKRKQPVYILKQ